MNILLAEDDTHIRQGLEEVLSAEGYTVIATENGHMALEQFAQQPIDFIILDVMMPILDGFSVCKSIRQHDKHIPILFLTAKSEEIDKVLGLEIGADDYISKPFGIAELRARIKTIARRCLGEKEENTEYLPFDFGDLTVYPAELRAIRQEMKHTEQHEVQHEIELSIREIKILQCLKNNANKVVSRDILFDHVWGYEHLPNSRTLDQHISKLRKQIERDPSNPKLIQTIHGQGYRYNDRTQ